MSRALSQFSQVLAKKNHHLPCCFEDFLYWRSPFLRFSVEKPIAIFAFVTPMAIFKVNKVNTIIGKEDYVDFTRPLRKRQVKIGVANPIFGEILLEVVDPWDFTFVDTQAMVDDFHESPFSSSRAFGIELTPV